MAARKIKIKENSWLARMAAQRLGYDDVAMVIGHTIHLYNTTAEHFMANAAWLRHELKHVEQYERYGLLGFLWKYLAETRRKGYFQNRFEQEAREAEKDEHIISRYDLSAYTRRQKKPGSL